MENEHTIEISKDQQKQLNPPNILGSLGDKSIYFQGTLQFPFLLADKTHRVQPQR